MPVTTWRYVRGPIEREDVGRLETEWNVRFPDDFVACVLKNNSGRPVPNTIDIDGWGVTCVKKLLDFNEPDDKFAETMRNSYQGMPRFLPDGVYTIASEPGGCYFCFDFRADPDSPRVVFWDHDRADETNRDAALIPVADSFTEFLELLYEDEDD